MTDGIEAVFLETRNWGKAARFFQALGYEIEFETDHSSGQLRSKTGPPLFIAEVPADREPGLQLVLRVPDATEAGVGALALDGPFEPTHFGTQMTTVRDPDGRTWGLQAPLASPANGPKP
ncbi:MAG TPA: VOC family protein [Trebonia sp.]|nr:VOC family protein [Trebonia sp.]